MIILKNSREIELLKKANQIVVEAFKFAESRIRPGVRTDELDEQIGQFIVSRGGRPAFKGYNGYPSNVCISIDDQVVHGIPGARRLKEGEIVSLDIGVECQGYYGDAAKTYSIGEISKEKARLLAVTRESLFKGIDKARQGNRLYDISHAIQVHVENAGFSVVRDLVGHGIGKELHEPPQIPNYGEPHRGPRLRDGMVLAIEPMVNMGGWEVRTESDRWTVVTSDGLPSAHFEHSVLITDHEPVILSSGI